MKLSLFLVFFTSLFFILTKNLSAESSTDYFKSNLGSMDLSLICTNENGSLDRSFKKINNITYQFEYLEDEKFYNFATSTVKVFKRKFQNQDINIYMSFAPLLPDYGIKKPGLILHVYLFPIQNKIFEFSYFVKDKDFSAYDEWISLKPESEDFDEKLNNWSENAYKKISKRLEFGKPFELVDLETINQSEIISDDNGFYMFQSECKKRM